jgi:hypothetical protein
MASFAMAIAMPSQVMLSSASGEKKGFLDWLSEALDKSDMVETDAILKGTSRGDGNGAPPAPKPTGAKKPAGAKKPTAPKKGGFGLWGK